jgi:hypothetical protein
MFEDGFGLRLGYYCREGGYVGLLYGLQAAEMFEQAAGGGFAYAGDFSQLGGAVADLAALAMEGYGEAMGFVADHLHQMQDGRMMVENYGVVFLSMDIDDFFSLGDRGQGLVDDFEGFERLGGGVELA